MSSIKRLAIFLVLLGVLFGLETYFKVSVLYKLWPVMLTSLGGGFVGIYYKRRRSEVTYLILGIYIVCFSILAQYYNFTSWGKLAYQWPVFIGFAGMSFLITYLLYSRNRIYLFSAAFFFSIMLIFFLVFSVSKFCWWLIFIFLGISLLLT
jgi:hypothetical protein